MFLEGLLLSHILNKLATNYKKYFLTFTSVTNFCVSDKKLLLSGDVELNPGPVQNNLAFITWPSYVRVEQRLQQFQLMPLDVGGAGDCFFRAVSHQLYGDPVRHLDIRAAGISYMRENPERFIESNTEHSWLQYLNNMSMQGTWCDGLIIQAVADQLNLRILIAESHEHFRQFSIIRAVSLTQRPTDIYLGHIDEYHYVSTLPCSKVSSIFWSAEKPPVKQNKNEHMTECMKRKCTTVGASCMERKEQYMKSCELMCYYSICFSTIKSCNYWNDQILSAISEHAMLLYQEVLKDGKEFTRAYMPKTINICGSDVGIVFSSKYQGTLVSNAVSSKHDLERLMLHNATGFLLWFSNYCFACIFQHMQKDQKQNIFWCRVLKGKQSIYLKNVMIMILLLIKYAILSPPI